MIRRWAGPMITALIVGGIGMIVAYNLNLEGPTSTAPPSKPAPAPVSAREPAVQGTVRPAGFREYPIGDPVEKNQMRVSAVWLPPILMDDGVRDAMSSDVIHLEADIRATEENPNGFAKDEFVPYLKIHYQILPTGSDRPIHEGELMPMIATDGLHYGASVAMPRPGTFRLVYHIDPPSAGGLGRHSDPVSGVAPWWKPFDASFEWDYPGPPKAN